MRSMSTKSTTRKGKVLQSPWIYFRIMIISMTHALGKKRRKIVKIKLKKLSRKQLMLMKRRKPILKSMD